MNEKLDKKYEDLMIRRLTLNQTSNEEYQLVADEFIQENPGNTSGFVKKMDISNHKRRFSNISKQPVESIIQNQKYLSSNITHG